MSDIFIASPAGRPEAGVRKRSPAGRRVAADWLCLAATPTFAIMALLAAAGGGEPALLCAAMHHASPLSGMVVMDLVMSVFHSGPWLKLICGR